MSNADYRRELVRIEQELRKLSNDARELECYGSLSAAIGTVIAARIHALQKDR